MPQLDEIIAGLTPLIEATLKLSLESNQGEVRMRLNTLYDDLMTAQDTAKLARRRMLLNERKVR